MILFSDALYAMIDNEPALTFDIKPRAAVIDVPREANGDLPAR